MTTFEARTAAHSFAPRPFAITPKKSDVLDLLVRTAVVQAYAHAHEIEIDNARQFLAKKFARYGDEATKAFCDYAAKGAVPPATTYLSGWAAELVTQSHADVIGAIMPRSGYAQLAALGLSLQFGRNGRIAVPSFSPSIAGAFVREGEPIPVAQGETSGQFLTRRKLAVITTFTSEIDESSIPSIEGLLRARIQESTGIVLDGVLFDDQPASDVRPAGLLYDVVDLISSGSMDGDLQTLADGLAQATNNHVRQHVLIMNPAQAFAMRLETDQDVCPIVVSNGLPVGTVIMLDAGDFVCAGGDPPRFDISGQAAIHMETLPGQLANGGQASPIRSLWQTNTLGLRMILQVDWCLRRPNAVAFMRGVYWHSGGGGTPVVRPTYTAGALSLAGSAPLTLEIGSSVMPTLTPTWTQNDAGPVTAYRLSRNGTQIFSGPAIGPHTDTASQLTAPVTYNAAVDHGQGPIKNDSEGNPYPTGRINAGTRTSGNVVYTPQRRAFYGVLADDTVPNDEAFIRGLSESLLGPANNSVMVVNVPNGARGACFAYPLTLRSPTSIISASTNIDVKNGFTTITTIDVPGANDFDPITYRVIYLIADFPFGGDGDTYTLTV